MPIFYSPGRHGFFNSDRHTAIPQDAVRISARTHRKLLDGQKAGGKIQAGPNGRPRLVLPAAPTLEQLRDRALRQVRREAGRRIEAAVPIWRQINDAADMARSIDAGIEIPPAAVDRRELIDALRARSNVLEQFVTAGTAEQLAALDPSNDEHWIS